MAEDSSEERLYELTAEPVQIKRLTKFSLEESLAVVRERYGEAIDLLGKS